MEFPRPGESPRIFEIGERFRSMPVTIPSREAVLHADLSVPDDARGLVLFAHGSGSGRHSPRNRYVAHILNESGLATLLADLLSVEEEKIDSVTRHLRFDIPLLAARLGGVTAWAQGSGETMALPMAYFGSSTGAAAALIAAARTPAARAVVSRGGRPDLAMEFLPKVAAPTLLIVGERDPEVLKLNRQALEMLNDRSGLDIVPGASHLFEEPGALEAVAHLAACWFTKHMG